MTESEQAQWGRVGALERWSRTPRQERRTATAAATAASPASLDRWEREIDPDGVLDPAERAGQATRARSAHMRRLAIRSAQTRRARGRQTADVIAAAGAVRQGQGGAGNQPA